MTERPSKADAATEPDAPAAPQPVDEVLDPIVVAHPSAVVIASANGHIASVDASELVGFVTAARDAGYRMFIDLCGVDYLRRRPRFEVVANIVDIDRARRLEIHVTVSADDPTLPSLTSVFPGANFYERETYDLFGIAFDGHPDLTRILLPDDWEGHPLRKDYAVGSVPVQFKEAHRTT